MSFATSPVALSTTLSGVCEKVSQIDGPRPSSLTAPSTWYEAVAVPQIKPRGKSRPLLLACGAVLEPNEGNSAVEASAVAPATFTNVRLENFLFNVFFLLLLPSKNLQGHNKTDQTPGKQYGDRNPVGRKRGAFVHQRSEQIV